MAEEPASAVHNITAGSGCGCGCLGALVVLAGAFVLAGIPLEVYEPSTLGTASWAGGIAIAGGVGVACLGIAVWVASLFVP